MTTLLIRGAEVVATMDDAGTEVSGGSILARDGAIEWVGPDSDLPPGDPPDEVVDASGCVAIPGLVNTHHHLYQVLTRVRVQDGGLFRWLTELYPTWAGLDEEWTRAAAGVGLAELALSGCTTSTDHHYVFPSGAGDLLAAEISVAREVGIRFHPCRGSMDLGESDGGLPPDSIVQDRDTILRQTEDAVAAFHDPSPGSMLRIAVAPCSPFSVTTELMKESAALARRLGLRLHTHIAEALDEDDFCLEKFGVRPIQLLEDLEFLGPDVWLAHGVHLSDADITRVAAAGTGIAHCPSSNLRLASGIARVRNLLDAGAPVGLGVDGSASNDSNDLLAEVRQAMLVARAGMDPAGLSAREALRIATRGGAACLGRDDEIGSLEPGKRADVALFDVSGLPFAGAEDFVAALAFCAPRRVRDLFVEGRRVVADGRLTGVDEERIAADGHRVARRIAEGATA
jgi:cytosine/adenosine deaminase-related metal-dependent hydrolase